MNFRLWLETEKDWKGFERQKYLPFMSQPDNPYYRKPPADDEYKDLGGDYGGYEAHAYYHVTPFLNRIKASQMLKSQAQVAKETSKKLRDLESQVKGSEEYQQLPDAAQKWNYLNNILKQQGHTSVGLGSGSDLKSKHAISLTYNYNRAVEIYEAFHFVVSIARNQISASQIWQRIGSDNDYSYDGETLSPTEEVLRDHGVPKKIIINGDEARISAILDKKITDPQHKYEFFQALEAAVTEHEMSGENDYITTLSQIGFTGDFSQMRQIDPKQIAIIQCVVRKNADVSHVPEEAEVRVSPEDVAIIRYIKP